VSYLLAGVDRSVAALGYEQAQMEMSLFGEGEEQMPLDTGTTRAREYVWGPGDRGTDELLVQYDTGNKPWYVIQDNGGMVYGKLHCGQLREVHHQV